MRRVIAEGPDHGQREQPAEQRVQTQAQQGGDGGVGAYGIHRASSVRGRWAAPVNRKFDVRMHPSIPGSMLRRDVATGPRDQA
ncbi:hypothetical protein GCM10022284_56420 [Streptomyces hundungensis]